MTVVATTPPEKSSGYETKWEVVAMTPPEVVAMTPVDK